MVEVDPQLFMNKVLEVFKYGAMLGFLVATTLLINLNNKAFTSVFREHSKAYFWFFLVISVIPLLAFIYVFNFLFGRLTFAFGPME
jgi:spore maturation protein SpmB